jgi:Pyruvate/2-oxoacid:ferredoxin oxidoreductase delta subunit
LMAPQLKKPLLVDTSRLQPITEARLQDSECAHCRKTRARWLFKPIEDDKPLFMCAVCWLYESEWSKNRREDLDALIADTEQEIGSLFSRDGEGRLNNGRDADRIMGAICALSRVMQMRGALGALSNE